MLLVLGNPLKCKVLATEEHLHPAATFGWLWVLWLPKWRSGKESVCQCRSCRRCGLGRSPGGGNGYPLQYSCLENPMDRGAWWATVHGVAESDTPEHACMRHMGPLEASKPFFVLPESDPPMGTASLVLTALRVTAPGVAMSPPLLPLKFSGSIPHSE